MLKKKIVCSKITRKKAQKHCRTFKKKIVSAPQSHQLQYEHTPECECWNHLYEPQYEQLENETCCEHHHSYARLVCRVFVDPLSPPPTGAGSGDPHLVFANGAKADFRGSDDGYYSMVSFPDFAINFRTRRRSSTARS